MSTKPNVILVKSLVKRLSDGIAASLLAVLIAASSGGLAAGLGVPDSGSGSRAIVGHAPPAYLVTADCAGEVRPDRVVIAGGMTSESVKPVDAQERIDRQLAELRKFVSAQGGLVILLERVRAARATRGRGDEHPESLPFMAMQRLEIEFPVLVSVDAVFERVLQFGLDRFGSNVRADYVDDGRHVAVRYRFSALRPELDKIHQRCRMEAVSQWCATEGKTSEVCVLSGDERDKQIRTRNLTLQTQPLLAEHGGVSIIHLNYPWRAEQLARIELLGNVAVRFQGTMQLDVADIRP